MRAILGYVAGSRSARAVSYIIAVKQTKKKTRSEEVGMMAPRELRLGRSV